MTMSEILQSDRMRGNLLLRAFTPADYPDLTAISNAVSPDMPVTVDEVRFQDEHRDQSKHWERWMAEVDGQVVGHAFLGHNQWSFHPRRYITMVFVHPERQDEGIGRALYERIRERLDALDAMAVQSFTRDDRPRALRFLRDRGFEEVMRYWESRLDVPSFDFAPYAGTEERVRATGVEIMSMAELAGTPDLLRRVYDLQNELDKDVPSPTPVTPLAYAHWLASRMEHPNYIPEAFWLAVDTATGELVGTTALWRMQAAPDILDTGLTGVKRSHRRRGIALALKLRAIAWAREQGVTTIKTDNESNNRAMLSINERLGFVMQPAWIDFMLSLQPETAGEVAP